MRFLELEKESLGKIEESQDKEYCYLRTLLTASHRVKESQKLAVRSTQVNMRF